LANGATRSTAGLLALAEGTARSLEHGAGPLDVARLREPRRCERQDEGVQGVLLGTFDDGGFQRPPDGAAALEASHRLVDQVGQQQRRHLAIHGCDETDVDRRIELERTGEHGAMLAFTSSMFLARARRCGGCPADRELHGQRVHRGAVVDGVRWRL